MCQRISRETGRQGGLPVFIWFSLLLGVVLFWVGAGIEKDGAAGCGSVCGVALSGAGAKKCTGSFAACAAGGVGRKAGRRWPCFNGQRRPNGLTAPMAAGRWGVESVLLSGLWGERNLHWEPEITERAATEKGQSSRSL